MFKKEVVCLEIGSAKLRVIVAQEGVNNTLLVKELATLDFDGYFQGEWVDEKRLAPSIFEILKQIDFRKKKYDKKLYIALPAEMTKVVNVSASINIEGLGKATKNDVDNLISQAISKAKAEECEVVSISNIRYLVDENDLGDPVGKKGRNLTGEFSVILCEKTLIERFNGICSDLGFVCVEYVSEVLCGATMLLPEEERRDGAILVDIGALSTSVTYIKGEGILALTSFSIGGGHITSDLCDTFDLTYEDGERLKKQVVISVEAGPLDYYDLPTVDGKIQRIPQEDANKVVAYRLEAIASAINQCLVMQGINLTNYIPVYLIGAGASKIKGGKDFLSKCLSRNIVYGHSDLPGKDKPEDGIIYAIAKYALKN